MLLIFDDIRKERKRQDELHPGTADMPDGTQSSGGRATYRNIAQYACDRAARENRLTFAHVLEEEVSEALAEEDPEKLRVELVQVAAVATKWIEKLDREKVARVNNLCERCKARPKRFGLTWCQPCVSFKETEL